MSTEQIIHKAMELGQEIAKSTEIQALIMAQQKVRENQPVFDLLNRYQEATTKVSNKIRDGLLVIKPERDYIDILEQQLNSNLLFQELLASQEKFNNLMHAVQFAINQAIFGSSCSEDGCSSCHGSCHSCE